MAFETALDEIKEAHEALAIRAETMLQERDNYRALARRYRHALEAIRATDSDVDARALARRIIDAEDFDPLAPDEYLEAYQRLTDAMGEFHERLKDVEGLPVQYWEAGMHLFATRSDVSHRIQVARGEVLDVY